MTNRIRSVTTWLMMLMLILGSGTFSTLAQGDTSAGGGALFSADGIDSAILAQADLADADAGATLLLELLEVAPDNELPPHQTTSPELFYVLGGVVTFQDDFGFVSAIDAGRVVTLHAGTAYTLSNADSETGRLLRVRLAGDAAATLVATPAPGDGDSTTILMRAPLEDFEPEGARIYLGRAQFGANTDSGDQSHSGPLGIYVEHGAVNVVSPSGLVGAIDAGRAVNLPAETPLRASTGDSETVAFITGVSGLEGEPFTRIWTEADGTAPNSVLESGQTWQTRKAELTVEIIPYPLLTRFAFTYTNIGDTAAEVQFDRNQITVTDDRGGEWTNPYATCEPTQVLDPGESISCRLQLKPPDGTDRGPLVVTIHVGAFGAIQDATWQTEIDR